MADSSVLVMLLIRFTVTTITYKSATFSPKHLISLLLDHTSKTVPLFRPFFVDTEGGLICRYLLCHLFFSTTGLDFMINGFTLSVNPNKC